MDDKDLTKKTGVV